MALLGQISSGSALTFDPRLKVAAGASPADDVVMTVTSNDVIVNGDFVLWTDPTVPDGWTKQSITTATLSEDASRLKITTDGADTTAGVSQAVLTAGKEFLITIKLDQVDDNLKIRVGSGSSTSTTLSTVGTHVFTMLSDGTDLFIRLEGFANSTVIIDSVLAQLVEEQTWVAGEDSEKVFNLPAGTYDVEVDQPDLIEQFDSPSDNWTSFENTTLETMDLLTVFDMENNDLLTANVDGILSSLIVNEALRPSVTADIVLSGTNEAPSDVGMTNAYSLVILADWTVDVTVNGSAVQVSTQAEVEAIDTDAETLTWNYDQTADIAATGNWDVIGDAVNIFSGVFDGLGHVIDGLTINSGLDNRAMFFTNGGQIKNLGLTNVDIDGEDNCGALAGENLNIISKCYSTGSVSAQYRAGGLVAINSQTIENCYSRASSTAAVDTAGGLVGVNDSEIIRSYSTGLVSAPLNAGGFIGISTDEEDDCFWDTQTSGQATSAGAEVGKTTAEMKTQSTFDPPWDFLTIWSMDGYPVLVVFDKQIGLFPGTGLFPKTPLMPTQGLFPNKGLYP